MKTTSTAWAAALAVMSITAPFTVAEAAPAPPQQPEKRDQERPKYYFPRHVKRQYSNITSFTSNPSTTSDSSKVSPNYEPATNGGDGKPHFNPTSIWDSPFEPSVDTSSSSSSSTSSTSTPSSSPAHNTTSSGATAHSLTSTESGTSSSRPQLTTSKSEDSTTSYIAPPSYEPTSSTSSSSSRAPSRFNQEPLGNVTLPIIGPTGPAPNGLPSSSSHETKPFVIGTGHPAPVTVSPLPAAPDSASTLTSRSLTHGSSRDVMPPPESIVLPTPHAGASNATAGKEGTGSSGRLPPPESILTPTSTDSGTPRFNPPRPLGTGAQPLPSGTGVPQGIIPGTSKDNNTANSTTKVTDASGSREAPIIVGISTILESSDAPLGTGSPRVTTPANTTTDNGTTSDHDGHRGGLLPDSDDSTTHTNATSSTTTSSDKGLLGGVLPNPTDSGSTTGPDYEPPLTTGSSTSLAVTGTSPTLSLPSATATTDTISSVVSSVKSEISSAASSIISDAGLKSTTGDASKVLSELASSLSVELSSVAATATDSRVTASLASEFSGILSSAASSIAEQTSTSSPASVSATSTAETLIGTGTSTGSYTLSTVTGTSGLTLVPIPMPTLTPGTSSSSSGSSASSYASSASSYASSASSSLSSVASSVVSTATTNATSVESATYPTSVPLTTGATLTLSESSTAVASSGSGNGTEIPAQTITPTASSTSSTSRATTTSEPLIFAPTASTVAPSTTPTTTEPARTSTTTRPPVSIVPTGTDSATTYSIQSSLMFAPTSSAPVTATSTETGSRFGVDISTSTAPTGMPSAMPRLVQPPGGMPPAPDNTTLIQIGFNYGLNYNFVVTTDNSASQIFSYLPQGLACGLNIEVSKVKMNALMPYDTTKTLNFITTLAQAYIPANLVDQLQLDLHNPASGIYQNNNPAVQQLMAMINPTIPILPGASMDEGAQSQPARYNNPSGESTKSNQRGGGAPIGGDSGSSQKVKGTSIGIGVGAVAGAAVYAAAMFYVARRYRKKRSSHQRTSSVPTAGEITQRSPALSGGGMGSYFMSGANGRASATPSGSGRGNSYGSGGRGSRNSGGSGNNRSVREQGISAPVMAENSLGWN